MATPVQTDRQKFLATGQGTKPQPLPETPKLPEAMRKRFPDLKDAFDKYDSDWEEYFKKGKSSGAFG